MVYDPPGVRPVRVKDPLAGAQTVGLLNVIVRLSGPAIVIGNFALHVLPAADAMDIVSVPGARLSVNVVVTPVKDCIVLPVTFTSQGDPVPPGTMDMTSLAKQVAGEITVNVIVGAGVTIIVMACVVVPVSGQLLSV